MKRTLLHATLSIAVGTIALACGGTKDSTTKGSSDAGKGGGSGGLSGSGTGGSSSGNGGAAGANTGAGGLPFKLPEGGIFGPPEKVVLDPTCPDQHVNGGGFMGAPAGGDGGTTVPGCCDKSGVCGVSTAPFARPGFISAQCLTAADIRSLFSRFGGLGGFGVDGGAASFDAGPPKACTYK